MVAILCIYPLESSKIVNKLSGVSTKSYMHKQGIMVAS